MAKYSRPMRMPSNEDRIYKMRMYENKLADNIRAVKDYDQQMRSAEFAEAHIKKREMREIEARDEAIRQCREQNLEIRRGMLAALLEGEEQLLNDELKTNSMTLAERRSWLEARSRALKQKQNAEACQKDQYVQEMLDKAWRDNADDVRIQDSKMAVLRAVEGRKRQLEEAVARKILEEQENRKLEEIMEREWKLKEKLLLAEVEAKAAKRLEAIDILHEQMELVGKLRAEEQAAIKAEMAAMNKRWAEEDKALEQQQVERKCYLVLSLINLFAVLVSSFVTDGISSPVDHATTPIACHKTFRISFPYWLMAWQRFVACFLFIILCPQIVREVLREVAIPLAKALEIVITRHRKFKASSKLHTCQ